MGAYIVLAAMTALGMALGWRLSPEAKQNTVRAEGLPRLLQIGIALTGLLVLALLLLPWFTALDQIACSTESRRASNCILGLEDRGLFGACLFVGLIGAAAAFVLRKGVLDLPEPEPEPAPAKAPTPAKVKDAPKPDSSADEAPKAPADAAKAKDPADEAPLQGEPNQAKAEAEGQDAEEDQDDEAKADDTEAQAAAQAPHRRLEGPVFRAFVDDDAVELDEAIRTAASRLRSERVAVVFSRGASKEANVALLELAEAFDAHRYLLEGNAAANEGVPREDTPDPTAVDEVVGPDARRADELALDLAGAFIQTVFLLDTRVAFPQFVLGKLTELQSVCIAHAHDEVSAACQVVLPGTNPGEREGELIDSDGGTNARRTREWLVGQIIAALRELESAETETEPSSAGESE